MCVREEQNNNRIIPDMRKYMLEHFKPVVFKDAKYLFLTGYFSLGKWVYLTTLKVIKIVSLVDELTISHHPGGSVCKESTHNAGDLGSVPGLGRSPGEGNGSPLQCSCLEKESPWAEEPGGLQSMGSQRVGHNWANKHMYYQSQYIFK